MTDHALAVAVAQAQALEATLQAYLQQTTDVAERDHVQTAFRRARPLRQALETWIALRALRTQLDGAAAR